MDEHTDVLPTSPIGEGELLAGSSATAGAHSALLRRALVVAIDATMLGLSVFGGASVDGSQIQIGTRFAAPVCYSDEIGTYFCHPSTATFFLKNVNSP